MAEAPSTITSSEIDDAATFKIVVETGGVQRHVTLTVSPRPTDADGWAEVVTALADLVNAHPERF